MSPLVRSLWIALGGAVGCNARYWLSNALDQTRSGAFPFGIAVVNISGSLVMGAAAGWLAKAHADSIWVPLVTVGFLGGYTTFSTFSMDFVRLAEDGHWKEALGYFFLSTVVSILFCAAGWAGVRKLIG